MRELKFRSWHKKYKKMYRVQDLHMAHIMNGGIWATVDGRDPIEDKDIYIQIQPKDILVMQFIGLCDKNGQEIYEGDIVKVIEHGTWYRAEVAFNLGWYMKPIFASPYFARLHFTETKNGSGVDDGVEVIGNIHKNPELLA